MRAHFLKFGKQTLIYGTGGIALPLVGVITLPIYTRAFSPAEYGVIEIGTVAFAVAMLLADFGLSSAALRHYYEHPKEHLRERRLVLSTATIASFTIATAIAIALFAWREPLAAALFDDQPYADVIALAGFTVPIGMLANFTREAMRVTERPWHFAIASALGAISTGVVGVYLVVGLNASLEAIFVAVLVGQVLTAAYGLAVSGKDISVGFSVPELRGMLAFGLPLIPTAFALWGLSFLDRVLLGQFADLADVGQYAVAGRFATVLVLTTSAFGLAFAPFSFSMYSEDRELEKRVRGRLLTYKTLVLTAIALGLSLSARDVVFVVAPGFDRAYQIVPLLCFGVVVYGVSNVLIQGISIARQSKFFAYYTTAAVALNLVLCVLLIPPFGMFGAAASTATAYVFLAAIYYRKAQQVYPTPYEPAKVSALIALGASLASIGLLHISEPWLDLSLKLAAAGAFCVGALAVLGREEISGLRGALSQLRPREIQA